MRSIVVRKQIILAAGIAVTALMLWITVADVRHWLMPANRNPNLIHVTEATFGESCRRFVPPAGHTNLVKTGNATVAVSQSCDNTDVPCPFVVDLLRLGDPAVGCEKDMSISWRCGIDQAIHHAHVSGNTVGSVAWISCPAREP
jgi:hypothetical protein